jgi:hypothetical protein
MRIFARSMRRERKWRIDHPIHVGNVLIDSENFLTADWNLV